MPFYTFIMDYRGGTYVSQINASSIEAACVSWARNLEVSAIYDFGSKSREKLIEQMESESPVLLDGLINAWCASALICKGMALINIVQTEKSSDNEQPTTDN